jgi:hypothetical protein
LFELGGVPQRHRTDRLSAAVHTLGSEAQFSRQYEALLSYYGLAGEKTQAGQPHENGDVEQSHHRIKEALQQALMLRGSREFRDRVAYEGFVREVLARRNGGRQERLAEERARLRPLPARRLATESAMATTTTSAIQARPMLAASGTVTPAAKIGTASRSKRRPRRVSCMVTATRKAEGGMRNGRQRRWARCSSA